MGLSLGMGISLIAHRRSFAPWQDVATILGPDLMAQWDVTNAPSVALSGTAVTGWTDLVGGVVLAPGGAPSRPVYSDNGFNSKGPAVTFDGVSDFLSVEQAPWLSAATPGEVWLCMRQDTPADVTAEKCVFTTGSNSTFNTSRAIFRNVLSGVNRAYVLAGNGTSIPFAQNVTTDFSGYHVVRATWSGTAMGLSFDGGAPATAAGVPATATQRTVLGASLSTAGSQSAIAVSTLIITNPLSAATASALFSALQGRY